MFEETCVFEDDTLSCARDLQKCLMSYQKHNPTRYRAHEICRNVWCVCINSNTHSIVRASFLDHRKALHQRKDQHAVVRTSFVLITLFTCLAKDSTRVSSLSWTYWDCLSGMLFSHIKTTVFKNARSQCSGQKKTFFQVTPYFQKKAKNFLHTHTLQLFLRNYVHEHLRKIRCLRMRTYDFTNDRCAPPKSKPHANVHTRAPDVIDVGLRKRGSPPNRACEW